MFNIGNMYIFAEGMKIDEKLAFHWYKKAADKGEQESMFNIGLMYEMGEGTTKNMNYAISWYTKSAEKGNLKSVNNLIRIYEEEDDYKDPQKATYWKITEDKIKKTKSKKEIKERLKKTGLSPVL